MTSGSNELPPDTGASGPDLILMALFQSRLRERSIYLGRLIQSQRRQLSASDQSQPPEEDSTDGLTARIYVAEQALAAVQEAERRLGRGRYGLCDGCSEPIGWDDLLQTPEQTTCRACSRLRPATVTTRWASSLAPDLHLSS